jgi:hypothetical protein
MLKPPVRKPVQGTRDHRAKRNPVQEAVHSFLRNTQVSSKSVACLDCGSTSGLKRATVSLGGTGETWEISLPLCERCACQDSARPVRSEREYIDVASIRGARHVECNPTSRKVAHLASEMSTIHSDNRLYWEHGSAVTLQARAEHQRRQDRLEEIGAAITELLRARRKADRPRALDRRVTLRQGRAQVPRLPPTNHDLLLM